MGMKWTVSERVGDIGTHTLTAFDIRESDQKACVAYLQSSEHCGAFGWTAEELRERARLMAAAPELSAAAYQAVKARTVQEVDDAREALIAALLAAHGDQAVYA